MRYHFIACERRRISGSPFSLPEKRRPEIRLRSQATVSSEMLQNVLLTRLGCCCLECYSRLLVYDFQSHQLADGEGTRAALMFRPPGRVKSSTAPFAYKSLQNARTDLFDILEPGFVLTSMHFIYQFEGTEIALDGRMGIFITMNPGYAGRTELPESVKALFRPVVCIVPDLQQICEIMLFSEGFLMAKVISVMS